MKSMKGVLLMAYGTPERVEDIEAYYTDIRRGRPPTPELLADLVRRYEAIGGISPLAQRTRAQRDGLQAALEAAEPDGWTVALGLKHAAPFVEDGVAALVAQGVSEVVGIVLAPHWSAFSVGQYHERAEAALAGRAPFAGVRSWHVEPTFVELLADRWRTARSGLDGLDDGEVETLVTAHSLPERIRAAGDPYPDQLRETGEALAAAAGIPPERWRVAWQSAGRTPEPWIGPDILHVIRGLPAEGRRGVVVCPAGFTADHLEVLYDIDVEARRAAEEAGLALVRTASLDDDPRLMALLADVARRAVGGRA
jgi:protoporphyrin/coproporphyrin ferrochelatase